MQASIDLVPDLRQLIVIVIDHVTQVFSGLVDLIVVGMRVMAGQGLTDDQRVLPDTDQ